MAEHRISARRLTSFWGRLRGLLGRPPPGPGIGVYLSPCRQVHTLGMGYPIDVLFLDREGIVVAIETLRPWRVGQYVRRSNGALEMRAGEVEKLGIEAGDRVVLIGT